MANPYFVSQAIRDSETGKAVSYMLQQWLPQHMEFGCLADANIHMPSTSQPQQIPLPLHFESQVLIRNRHYNLELTKVPTIYLMQELRLRWQPHLDAHVAPPPNFKDIPKLVNDRIVDHESGFYRLVAEVSTDYKYLFNLQLSRI